MGCVRGDSAFGGITAHQGHVVEGRHQYSSAQLVPVHKLLLLAGPVRLDATVHRCRSGEPGNLQPAPWRKVMW